MKGGLEIMQFDRTFGPSFGSTYYMTSTLTFPTGETIDMKIELNETLSVTNFKYAASGPGFSGPWESERVMYDYPFTVNGVNYMLRYQAYSSGASGIYDDVMFAIYPETDPKYEVDLADQSNPNVFNLMSYNVFMRPTLLFFDDQDERATHLPDYMHDFDAIMLQEVFDNTVRPELLAALAVEYPYQTGVVGDPNNPLEDGGVLIISRFPIELEDQELWGDNCNGEDCISNKGIKYAVINKLGKKYHLFSTHMDSFNDPEDIEMRKIQLVQWRDYVDAQNIPAGEAVLMGGDYNIDRYSNKEGEYDSLFTNSFKSVEPVYQGEAVSWDTDRNHYLLERGIPSELLDYILPRNDYGTLISSTNTPMTLRSQHVDLWRVFDLSDHSPIWGRFEYQDLTSSVTSLPNHLTVVLAPNPTHSTVRLTINSTKTANMRYDIINSLGQIMKTGQVDIVEGMNELPLSMGDFANGLYTISLRNTTGELWYNGRIAKQ